MISLLAKKTHSLKLNTSHIAVLSHGPSISGNLPWQAKGLCTWSSELREVEIPKSMLLYVLHSGKGPLSLELC
jgi:hypothetical protein